jgi:3-oxoadipate enol-lactonase
MEHGVARSGNQEIAYTVEGRGSKTVLLITGLTWRAADWGSAFPSRLGEAYRVVRMDNRGAGASTLGPDPFTLEDMAADAVAVLDAVGAAEASVVGISMGGMITQLMLLEHPDRVERAVLMATHFGGSRVARPTPEAMRLFDPATFTQLGADPVAMIRLTLDTICAPSALRRDPGIVELMVENVRRAPTPGNAVLAQVQAIFGSNRDGRLANVSCPTLVMHGEDDTLIPPANGKMIAEQIPGARLVLLEECGHAIPLEQPARSAEAVLAFLE